MDFDYCAVFKIMPLIISCFIIPLCALLISNSRERRLLSWYNEIISFTGISKAMRWIATHIGNYTCSISTTGTRMNTLQHFTVSE